MLNPKQRAEIDSGIGASECAAILGINPYMTAYQLWRIKTGLDTHDISGEPHVIMGNLLEPVIAERYAMKTGEKVVRVNAAYRHKDFPHILAHIDRRVVGKRKLVEIKKASPFSKEWGEVGSDVIPPMYIAQVQAQFLASNGLFDEGVVSTYRGGVDTEEYYFTPDVEIMAHILEKVNHFWFENVLKNVAPEPSTRGDLALLYPMNDGNYIEASDTVVSNILQLNSLKGTLKETEEKKKAIEKEIIQFIADKDGLHDADGVVLATFKANKNGTRALLIKGGK
jgi:putative phage-type endonuclease